MPHRAWYQDIDLTSAEELLDRATPDWLEVNKAFYEGDHWQDEDGWVGPVPRKAEPNRDRALEQIERAFTSRNVIREVVGRHADGVVGQEPDWGLVPRGDEDLDEDGEPTDQVQELIEEAEDLLRGWWDEHDVGGELQEATATLLWATRAPLRLFVPSGVVREAGDGTQEVPAGDVEEQLNRIHMDAPDPTTSTVHTDELTQRDLAVTVYEVEEGEPGPGGSAEQVKEAQLAFVEDAEGGDGPGQTVFRLLREHGSEVEPMRVELGGRLPLREMEREEFVTEQVRQAQRALNLALSMVPRNVVTGGFLERVLLNAEMPGTWEEKEDGTEKFVPDPVTFGAGSVNVFQGHAVRDEEGQVRDYTTPRIEWRDPVPVEPSVNAKEAHYEDILGETDQLHVLIQGDATASGKSREQARSDYERSLKTTRTPVQDAVAWMLETALAMAEAFAGEPGKYTDRLRVTASAHLDLGSATPEERQAIAGQVEDNLLSRRTAMSRLGVEDVEAELRKIQAQEDSELEMRSRQAEVVAAFAAAGLGLVEAAKLAGFDEEEAEAIFRDAQERQQLRVSQARSFGERAREALERGAAGNGGGEGGE